MKNKLLALACVTILITCRLFAVSGDTLVSFGTEGPDTYSDGKPVLDGECYVLVWTKDNCEFGGFNSDASLVSDCDKAIVFAPIAKDGCCPPTLFQIDEKKAKEYAGGSYAIYLLDTRIMRNGVAVPVDFVNGQPRFISGYSPVIGSVKTAATSASIREKSNSARSAESSATSSRAAAQTAGTSVVRNCASNCAAVPADLDQPKITAIKVTGDQVHLTIQNLPGFIGVRGSETVTDFGPTGSAIEADGESESVNIDLPLESGSSFFKAYRAR